MLLLLFIILLPVFIILEAAKKSQDPTKVLFFCDYILIRQAQQDQQNQQDAGPAEPAGSSRLLASGFSLLVIIKILIFTIFYNTIKRSCFWVKRNPPRQPGAGIFAPKSYTKVTQKVGRKLHTKVTQKLHAKVTCESYMRKLEMKVTYNSSYFIPICPQDSF